jgi:hypothetical protein
MVDIWNNEISIELIDRYIDIMPDRIRGATTQRRAFWVVEKRVKIAIDLILNSAIEEWQKQGGGETHLEPLPYDAEGLWLKIAMAGNPEVAALSLG